MSLRRLIHPPGIALAPASLVAGMAWTVAIAALATAALLAPRLFAQLPGPTQPAAVEDKGDVRTLVAALARQQLFANQSDGTAARADERRALADIVLVGVATGFAGGTAFAVFERDGRSVAHRAGDTVAGDWQLLRILSDRVELGAGEQRLDLPLHRSARMPPPPRSDAPDTLQED